MMKDTLSKVIIFAAGVGIGSAVTWKLLKTKYEQIAQEEIDSVREVYENESKKENDGLKSIFKDEESYEQFKEDLKKPAEGEDWYKNMAENIIRNLGYSTDFPEPENEYVEEDEEDMGRPYVISPDEVGEADYPIVSLDYFEGDDTLANDNGEIVCNVDELVGDDFAEHFGEFERDTVYIRNDEQQVDYEILRDYRSYSEV